MGVVVGWYGDRVVGWWGDWAWGRVMGYYGGMGMLRWNGSGSVVGWLGAGVVWW